ncbi:MAG: hypothetical protein ABIO86_17135 [Sphingomonas sp.]
MRGHLSIASQRAPYLRAGLDWPSRGEKRELYIRELSVEQLLELARDPVLTASLEVADGKVIVLRFTEGDTVKAYADLLSSFPELPVEAGPADFFVANALSGVADAVRAAGFESVDALIAAYNELHQGEKRFPFELTIGSANDATPRFLASFASVEELQQWFSDYAKALHAAGFSSLDELLGQIASLRSELDTLKATPPAASVAKPAGKPKAGTKPSTPAGTVAKT